MPTRETPSSTPGVRLGERIRALRALRAITQERLAWESGHAKSYLSEIESGRKQPSFEVLGDLARTLGVPTWALLLDPAEDARAALVEAVRTADDEAVARWKTLIDGGA